MTEPSAALRCRCAGYGGRVPDCPVHGDHINPAAANRQVEATDGWTPLEFYAFIIRSLGLPASFTFNGETWVGEGPFTKPVPQSILELLEAQGV